MQHSDADKQENIDLLTLELLYGPGLFVIPEKKNIDSQKSFTADSPKPEVALSTSVRTSDTQVTVEPAAKLAPELHEAEDGGQIEPVRKIQAGLILFAERMDDLTPAARTMLEKISGYVATQLLPEADIVIQGKGEVIEKRPFAVGFGPEAGPLKFYKPVMAGGRLVLLLPAAETLANDVPLKLKAIDALKVWADMCLQQHD